MRTFSSFIGAVVLLAVQFSCNPSAQQRKQELFRQLQDSLYSALKQEDLEKAKRICKEAKQSFQEDSRLLKKVHLWETQTQYSDSIQVLASSAVQNYNSGNYEKASEEFESALRFCERPVLAQLQPSFIDQLYRYAANSLIQLGQYDKAEPLLLEALRLTEPQLKPELHDDYQLNLFSLVYLYLETNRFEEAHKILFSPELKETLERFDPQQLALYNNNIAQLFFRTRSYQEAHTYFNRAIALEQNEMDNGVLLTNKAWVFALECRYDSALVYFSKAAEKFKKNELQSPLYKVYFAKNRNGWGWVKNQLKEHQEAITSFKEALAFTDSTHDDYPRFLFNLANAYAQKGDTENALQSFIQSITLYQKRLLKYYPYLSDEQKANFFSALHLKFERFYSFILLEYTLKGAPLPEHLCTFLYNLQIATKGLLYSPNKKMALASNEAAKQNPQVLLKWQKLEIALRKANNRNNEKKLDSLIREFQKIEEEVFRLDPISRKAFKNKLTYKDIQKKLGDKTAAIEIIRFRAYDKNINPYVANCQQEGFTDSSWYAALILKKEGPPECLLLPESSQFETVFYPHYNAKMDIVQNDSLLQEYHTDSLSFDKFWKPIQARLIGIDTVYIAPEGIYNHVNLQTLQLSSGKYLIDSLEIRIVTNTKDILTNQSYAPSSNNTASLASWVSLFLGLLIVVCLILFIKQNSELWLLIALLATIWLLILSFFPRAYKTVFLGFADHNALPTKKNSTKIPNVVRQAHTLFKPQMQKFIRKIKNPKLLEASRQEIENSASIMNGYGIGKGYPASKFMGTQAQKNKLWELQSPWVLHIATHGFYFSDPTPNQIDYSCLDDMFIGSLYHLYRSGLVFSGAIEAFEDPAEYWDQCVLTAYEAMHLNLAQTELVALSACESGLGDYKNSFAIHGLPGAFKTAGAKSVIVSLRPVYDKTTSEFMTTFYKAWQKENNKYRAFRVAQNTIRAKMPHPANWGALVLVE
jgi:tetratricopeptide (TPR) repeat protein